MPWRLHQTQSQSQTPQQHLLCTRLQNLVLSPAQSRLRRRQQNLRHCRRLSLPLLRQLNLLLFLRPRPRPSQAHCLPVRRRLNLPVGPRTNLRRADQRRGLPHRQRCSRHIYLPLPLPRTLQQTLQQIPRQSQVQNQRPVPHLSLRKRPPFLPHQSRRPSTTRLPRQRQRRRETSGRKSRE